MQKPRNRYTHIKQNIFALKALFYIQQLYIYAASRNCIYSTSRNDILVNCKEIISSKGHIFIHKMYNHSRQLYSFTESYSFQGTYQFILQNIYIKYILLSILQTVSTCARYTTFLPFGSRFHRQNLLIPQRSLLFTH